MSKPELLILDEPTAGLDMKNRAEIVAVMDEIVNRKNGPTLIVVSHHIDELPDSVENVMLIKDGKIFKQGSSEDLINSENMSHVFGCRIEISKNNGRFTASVQL